MVKKSRRGKPSPSSSSGAESGRHPLSGALKGMTFIAPGVDLTEPADPEWGKVYDDVEQVSDSVTRSESLPRKK